MLSLDGIACILAGAVGLVGKAWQVGIVLCGAGVTLIVGALAHHCRTER